MPDPELTELVELDVDRIDGVKSPANGFPFLILKSLAGDGEGESLPEDGSVWGDPEAYAGLAGDSTELEKALTYVIKRNVSAAERKRLASEGKALPDGSYPIANAEDLHNAATLARSGHGNVAAAKRLIAKRARELGVANPLDKEPASKMTDTQNTGTQTPASPEPQAALTKEVLDEALAKANAPITEKLQSLDERLSKVEQTPIPGPVVTASVAPAEKSQKVLEVKRLRQMADRVTDRELAAFYMAKAREIEQSA
jgi:hypothetical protein